MLTKEKLADDRIVDAIEKAIKENYNFWGYKYLIGKNNEVLIYSLEDTILTGTTEYHLGYLYQLSCENGKVSLHNVLKCGYEFVQYANCEPYLNIEIIRIRNEEKLKIGLGTAMISYLEHLALKKNCFAIQGSFVPIKPATVKDVKHFYERNGYTLSYGGREPHLRKDREKFKPLSEEKIGRVVVTNTTLASKELDSSKGF